MCTVYCVKSHQVNDGVDREVRVGGGVPTEEALVTQHLDQGGQLGWEGLAEILLLALLALISRQDVDNGHDLAEVLRRLVEGVRQGGLDRVLGDEVGLGDEAGEVPDDGAGLAYPYQGVVHGEDRELAEGKLAGDLGRQEAATEELALVCVSVGDVAIGQDHAGHLAPGPHREVDKGQIRSHDLLV